MLFYNLCCSVINVCIEFVPVIYSYYYHKVMHLVNYNSNVSIYLVTINFSQLTVASTLFILIQIYVCIERLWFGHS